MAFGSLKIMEIMIWKVELGITGWRLVSKNSYFSQYFFIKMQIVAWKYIVDSMLTCYIDVNRQLAVIGAYLLAGGT